MDQNEIVGRVFQVISENAGRGASGAGEVADWLLTLGLGAAQINNILNGVATSAQATPQMIAYSQDEMRALQTMALQNQQPKNQWVLPVVILGAIVFIATSRRE